MDADVVSMEHYVYGIAVNGLVRYIGKGCKQRAWSHVQYANRVLAKRAAGEKVRTTYFYNKLCSAIKKGDEIYPFMMVDGLTAAEAYAEERSLITTSDGLWNQMSGGIGPSSDDMKKMWALHRDGIVAAMNTPERKAVRSAASKKKWQNPEIAGRVRQSMLASWDGNEERRAHISARMKDRMASAMERQKMSASASALWAERRDEMVEKIRAGNNTSELRAIRSERMKEVSKLPHIKAAKSASIMSQWNDPAKRAALIAKIKEGKARRRSRIANG